MSSHTSADIRPGSVSTQAGNPKTARLAYMTSHPVQYQVPLLRRIAQEPDISFKAFFSSDHSVREQGYLDTGFGVEVKWDVPLLGGYEHEFLPALRPADGLGFAKPFNWGIFSRLQQGRFDALWVFGYHRLINMQAILAANALRIPVFIQTDSRPSQRPRKKRWAKTAFLKALKPAITGVLSIGQENEEYWGHYFGRDFPMFRMRYAVDNEFFRHRVLEAAPHRDELRAELGLEPGRPVILFAAKLRDRKRCIDLLDAYIRLAPGPGIDPHAYLLIVGNGEERAHLEERAQASGLRSIRFLGFRNQTELPQFYDLCDIFVLPSHQEPWGLVINEVMNAGRPVVVTDQVGCHKDLVQDGINGYVVPALDVQALSRRLATLIADQELRASMGANSLRLIQASSLDQNVAGLRSALEFAVPGFKA